MEKPSVNNPLPLAILKSTYRKIGTAKSPALCGSLVSFSNVGFDHLIHKRRKFRSPAEQRRRFALLGYAKGIIEKHEAKILYREQSVKNSVIRFWAFHAVIEDRKIKVVVSQINHGKKQFLSIMDDEKQKGPVKGLFEVPATS